MDKKELVLTRTFAAPIEEVWKAWTTPEAWVEWYGKPGEVPKGSAAMDVRVGGRWKSTTIAEGDTINFEGEFREVEKPHHLVMTIDSPKDPNDSNLDIELVTVDLKEVDGKTEMTFKQSGHLPPEEYQVGLREGWTGFFDHLEKYLATR